MPVGVITHSYGAITSPNGGRWTVWRESVPLWRETYTIWREKSLIWRKNSKKPPETPHRGTAHHTGWRDNLLIWRDNQPKLREMNHLNVYKATSESPHLKKLADWQAFRRRQRHSCLYLYSQNWQLRRDTSLLTIYALNKKSRSTTNFCAPAFSFFNFISTHPKT